MQSYQYPPDVAKVLHQQWPPEGFPLPKLPVLTQLIAVAFQASLLREEDRPVRCHVLVAPQANVPAADLAADYQVLAFHQPHPYGAQELRRLSPTVQQPSNLLAVDYTPAGELHIWGMVLATRPWENADDPDNPSQLPPALFMQLSGPGRLAFFCGPQRVLVWQQGELAGHGLRDLPAAWLAGFVGSFPASLTSAGARAAQELTWQLARYALRRCLALVRTRGHGGMAVLVPGDEASRLVGPGALLQPKYGVQANHLGTRYLWLLTHVITRSTELGISSWEAYRQTTDGRLRALHTEIEHFATLLADLMGVDGALVLSKQFEILGFGVELHAPPLSTDHVYQALNHEATQRQAEAANSGGTRHRAAYRLCQAEPDCLVMVVSQDGGIRLVRHLTGQVVFWNQLIL